MTLRLDPDAAATVVRAHHTAADTLRGIGDAPEVEAGEATGEVGQLLDALRTTLDNIAQVHDVVALHVERCDTNVTGTDTQIGLEFATAAKQLP